MEAPLFARVWGEHETGTRTYIRRLFEQDLVSSRPDEFRPRPPYQARGLGGRVLVQALVGDE